MIGFILIVNDVRNCIFNVVYNKYIEWKIKPQLFLRKIVHLGKKYDMISIIACICGRADYGVRPRSCAKGQKDE